MRARKPSFINIVIINANTFSTFDHVFGRCFGLRAGRTTGTAEPLDISYEFNNAVLELSAATDELEVMRCAMNALNDVQLNTECDFVIIIYGTILF